MKTLLKRGDWDIIINERVENSPQAEVRNGAGVVIIVSLGDGYVYKHYGRPTPWNRNMELGANTKGYEIHFAISGPLQCTFKEWDEINLLMDEASDILFQIKHARAVWYGTGEEKEEKFEGLNDLMEELGY